MLLGFKAEKQEDNPMGYVDPKSVLAPRDRISEVTAVLYDGKEDNVSIVILQYDGKPRLAIRWNGNDEEKLGFPSVRQYPVWFLVPDDLVPIIEYAARELNAGHKPSLPLDTDSLVSALEQRGYHVTLTR